MKSLAFVHRNDARGAVGDFSPVLSVFTHYELGNTLSPFLLLDHIGPGRLLPSAQPRGVHEHPHRGFETVTLVFAGELEHRDSSGHGGLVGPGDVQWMTAARGVVHRELFSPSFGQAGGAFEMLQLWVNLPAAHKMDPPRYQHLERARIPVVPLAGGAGEVRVIAGRHGDASGPALTHTPMTVLDVHLAAGHGACFATAPGDTAAVYLRAGRLRIGDEVVEDQGLAVLSQREAGIEVTALEDCRLLVLAGARIDEPLNAHGPFVMNTHEEVLQAYEDFKAGRLAPGP
ncbi:MAG TPA: pirin family protein [Moraxellaceae bacterium]|nr:pirin family protein [Moraxellaceae bacterium]